MRYITVLRLGIAVPTCAVAQSSGSFSVRNGQIYAPEATAWSAHGINLYDSQMFCCSTLATNNFPGMNMVRLAVQDPGSTDAASLQSFINQMTSQGIVVEIEDHHADSNDANNALTGSALQSQAGWYASLASAYKNNPYVWFGTPNEPMGADPVVAAQQVAVYKSIRATGNLNPVMLEMTAATLTDPASYAKMSNIIWDEHYYGWQSNYSTDIKRVRATQQAQAASVASIVSANGPIPIIIGEYAHRLTAATRTQTLTKCCRSPSRRAPAHWLGNGTPAPMR